MSASAGEGDDKTGRKEDIVAALEFFSALGVERLPVRPSMLKALFSDSAVVRGTPPAGSTAPEGPSAIMEHSVMAAAVTFAGSKKEVLDELRADIGDCRRCRLSEGRNTIVFGEGSPNARLMFIGEGPGEDEDLQGRPFVGKAGTLLNRLIEKMELRREDVYIANIVKCRPQGNREPEGDEVAACRGFLEKQIEIISPVVIITLGKVALQALTGNPALKITASRGKFIDYRGIAVMPTFHPAYLLRNPADKWKTWSDAQKALEKIMTRE